MVETDHPVNLGAGQVLRSRNPPDRILADMAKSGLHIVEDGQQRAFLFGMPFDDFLKRFHCPPRYHAKLRSPILWRDGRHALGRSGNPKNCAMNGAYSSNRVMDRSAAWLFVRTVVTRDWRFLSVTLLSCAVAAIVATFQYSVFTSFVRTGAVVPRVLGGDFWVTAATVECFDFPVPISEDYVSTLARYTPGAEFRRVVFGFAPWNSPTGRRGNVAIVGVDGLGIPDTGFVVERSDMARLDLTSNTGALQQASISDTTLSLHKVIDSLPTFLGAAYVLVPLERGRELLRMDPSSASFLIGTFTGAKPDFTAAQQKAQENFPEVAMVSAKQFQDSSSRYWQRKTGAGNTVLVAAVLATLLMAFLLANGLSRFIQRYHNDFISLLGHGASDREISQIVTGVAAIVAIATVAAALIVTPIMIQVSQILFPWVKFDAADMGVPVIAILASLGVAILSSRRAVAQFDPAAVFRS